MTSHPVWVRGLKPILGQEVWNEGRESHPVWVRGLKPYYSQMANTGRLSHPVWVRGLKPLLSLFSIQLLRRTLYGCVD